MKLPLLLALLSCLALQGCGEAPAAPAPAAPAPAAPVPAALVAAEAVAVPVSEDAGIDAFYEVRRRRPLWVGSGGERRLLAMLAGAWADGFDPQRYRVGEIAEALGAGD
ncbi:MAG: hypothetical protein M3N07_01145, partial [Pseudomonadota bacterium]|nr:hypothetical protein [Pseudomonadota bacterium]